MHQLFPLFYHLVWLSSITMQYCINIQHFSQKFSPFHFGKRGYRFIFRNFFSMSSAVCRVECLSGNAVKWPDELILSAPQICPPVQYFLADYATSALKHWCPGSASKDLLNPHCLQCQHIVYKVGPFLYIPLDRSAVGPLIRRTHWRFLKSGRGPK